MEDGDLISLPIILIAFVPEVVDLPRPPPNRTSIFTPVILTET